MMTKPALSIAALCLLLLPARASDPPLFKLDASTESTLRLFEEIERDAHASLVEVRAEGGSVAARSTFLMQASCALLAERGRHAFRMEQVSRQPTRLRLHFVDAGPDRSAPDQAAGTAPASPVIHAGMCEMIAQLRPPSAPASDRPASRPTSR